MKKKIIAAMVLTGSMVAGAGVLTEDFDSSGDWAFRRISTASALVTNSVLQLKVDPTGGQPAAGYHSFDAVTLQDGQTLRVSVDVTAYNAASRASDVRIGLGFATSAISGTSTILTVPLNGYYCQAPSGGNATDPKVSWIDSSGGNKNFFNAGAAAVSVGSMTLDDSVSISTTPKTLVWEITRSASDLVFSGSLDGTAFGTTTVATGANVISGFQFNTVGLAYAYALDQTVEYDNLRVEVIPEPATLGLFLLGSAGALALRRL